MTLSLVGSAPPVSTAPLPQLTEPTLLDRQRRLAKSGPRPSQLSRGTGRSSQGVHLYAAFLGGPLAEGRMGEGHEVVLVVAADLAEAKAKAEAKWSGAGRGHVDALQRIDMVDGFEVSLAAGRHPAIG